MKGIEGDKLRGHLETLILSVLERGDAHGLEILRRLEVLGCGLLRLKEGSLYPALYRLEEAGKIAGLWEEEPHGRRGATAHLSLDRQRKTRIVQRPRGLGKLRPGHRRNCRSSGMNENTHKALMIEVERAVRPVRTSQARKLRMREELLAHLSAIFEEEATRSSDEQSALDQAKQRFGDPCELAHELQQTVPITSRTYYLLEMIGFRMMGDSPLMLVAKGLLFTISILAITAPLLLIALDFQGKTAEFGMREIIVIKTLVIIMGSVMLGVVFLSRLYRTFFAEGSRRFRTGGDRLFAVALCISIVGFHQLYNADRRSSGQSGANSICLYFCSNCACDISSFGPATCPRNTCPRRMV